MVKEEKKKEEEESCCRKIAVAIFLMVFASAILYLIALIFMQEGQYNIDVSLSQDVANEICMQLTGEDYVVASDDYYSTGLGNGGNLVCDVFDEGSSKGIIVNR